MNIENLLLKHTITKAKVGSIPYLEIGDIDLSSKLYELKEKSSVIGAVLAKKNNILVSTVRPTRGAITILSDDNLAVSNAFAVLPVNESICLPKYLFYSINNKKFFRYLGMNSRGATYPTCSKKDILEYTDVHQMPMVKQQMVVDAFDGINEIINRRKLQLIEYDHLIKSRFVEIFGDIFNGKSNYSTIKISEAVVPKIERAKKDFNADDEIKYLDISSVDNGKNIIIGYTDYLMKDAPSRAQQHLRKDDIVISTVRPNLNNVAKVTHDYSNIVASSGFCVLRASKVEPNFLFALVSMQSFADHLASLTTGANYPAVSDKDILNFEIPNAPFEEQTKFSDFIKQVDKLKVSIQKSLDETQTLFDSLMQKYFG